MAYEQYGWTIDTVILCCVRCFDITRTLLNVTMLKGKKKPG